MSTPRFEPRGLATRLTCRASHGAVLAALTNSAAGDFLGQRASIYETDGGDHSLYYWSRDGVKYLRITATVVKRATYTLADGVNFDLSIEDQSANVVTSASSTIAAGLDTTETYTLLGNASGRRWEPGTFREIVWYLSVEDLVTAGLTAGEVWRFDFSISCGATVRVANLAVQEVPRYAVDLATPFGQGTEAYLPRGPIKSTTSGVQRLLQTDEWAYENVIGTYHHLSLPTTTPLTVASATYTSFSGDEVSAGVARTWYCFPRNANGFCRVAFRVRYKTSGVKGGKVRLVTTNGGSPFALALPGTSNVWADSDIGLGYLSPGGGDSFSFEGQVNAGTLSLITRAVVDSPE